MPLVPPLLFADNDPVPILSGSVYDDTDHYTVVSEQLSASWNTRIFARTTDHRLR